LKPISSSLILSEIILSEYSNFFYLKPEGVSGAMFCAKLFQNGVFFIKLGILPSFTNGVHGESTGEELLGFGVDGEVV
jgi:hypothetical protein